MRFVAVLRLTLLLSTSAAFATPPTITSVTPLPNHQIRVCWKPVPDAAMYWIEGSEDVENVVLYPKGDEAMCRDVNLFGATACQYGFVTLRVATPEDGMTFGSASPHFHFVEGAAFPAGDTVSDDSLAAAPICSSEQRYPTIEGSVRVGPSNVEVRDATKAADARPHLRIEMSCIPPNANKGSDLDHYEIYESTLKADGSEVTRTINRPECANGTELTGDWGDRSTITVAIIYRGSDGKFSHTYCSTPRVMTYGSSLLAAPTLRLASSDGDKLTVEGTAPKGAQEVLLLGRSTSPYQLNKPLQRVMKLAADGKFSATVDREAANGALYAIARGSSLKHDLFSDPVSLNIEASTQQLYLAELPPINFIGHQLLITGSSAPFHRIHVRVFDEEMTLADTDLYSCGDGSFGGDLQLGDYTAGRYTVEASDGTNISSSTVFFNKIDPAPRISLDQGTTPLLVNKDQATISGRVTPIVRNWGNAFHEDEGIEVAPYAIGAELNGVELPAVMTNQESAFEIVVHGLRRGSNTLNLTVSHPTARASVPVSVEIISRKRAQGIDLEAANAALASAIQLLNSEMYDDARKAATKTLELNPLSPRAYAVRAATLIRAGDGEGAYRDSRRALQLDERTFEGHAFQTELLFTRGEWEEVIEATTRAIALEPALILPWDNRAYARLQLHQIDGAIADANHAIELDESNSFGYMVRARALEQKGSYTPALKDAAKAVELDPRSSEAHGILARVWSHFGNDDDVMRELRAITDEEPQSEELWNTRAWTEYGLGRFDDAIADATHSIELVDNSWAHGTRAWARAAKGDIDGAMADLAKAKELDPDYSGHALDDGLLLFIRGDYRGAIQQWTEGIRTSPSSSEIVDAMIEKAKKANAKR